MRWLLIIWIRNGLFETNSSSVYAFCIPGNNSLKIPKEIKLSQLDRYVDITNINSIEDKLAYMYSEAEDNGCKSDFIEYLRSKGITIINDLEDNNSFNARMFNYNFTEDKLDNLLFNPDSTILFNPRYEEIKKLESDGYDII